MQSDQTFNSSKKQTGRWSREEHQRFMLGLMQYGKNWKKVEEIVATRSGSQVRSHAQKFFNKLQKGTHEPKTKKQRKSEHAISQNNDDEVSFNENTDQIRSLEEDYSLATPLEIISLIKKESIDNRKVNLSNFKKSLEENGSKKINLKSQELKDSGSFLQLTNKNVLPGEHENQMAFTLNSFKSMNNILSAYEALNETDPVNHFEDESFLIGLTKKYKKYFSKGGHFENLIDFGNPHEVAKAAEIEKSMRKKSWTLPEGFDGDENDLEDIKKKLKENKGEQNKEQDQLSKSQTKQKGQSVTNDGIILNELVNSVEKSEAKQKIQEMSKKIQQKP